jgi:putative Mn2+ efflux pump MntP
MVGAGIHAMREAIRKDSLRSTLPAGLAVSTDEIAAGFPLGVSGLPIAAALVTTDVQTVFVTALGVRVGHRIRASVAMKDSRYAGIAFAGVGPWLIAERLLTPVPPALS